MSDQQPTVLFEDNHLLALLKPAGVLSMGDDTGDVTMVDIAREYMRVNYNKPGNIFVGVVHRLDRPVSGVLLFASTSKAASRLSDQFRRGTVKKTYRAIVETTSKVADARLVDWLRKDHSSNIVSCVNSKAAGAQECILEYRVQSQGNGLAHLNVEPITGRSHQIRVQLASRQMPIVGDVKYGSRHPRGGRISLHAHRLEFDHPTLKTRMEIVSEIPSDL